MSNNKKIRFTIGYFLIIGLLLICCFQLYPLIGFWWTLVLVILTPVIVEFGSKWISKIFNKKEKHQTSDGSSEA
ncbi:MAG: hypothetical protein RR202_10235 [Bacteroidales bacterium]